MGRAGKIRISGAKMLCMIPGCNRVAEGNGLCPRHRGQLNYRLRKCKTEAERKRVMREAVRMGLALPSGRQRKAGGNVFSKID